ncbi:MAG: hypothetical protein WDO15_01545 [Bacteroidota bacterium]
MNAGSVVTVTAAATPGDLNFLMLATTLVRLQPAPLPVLME